jgi:hypothetical protein
VLRVFKTLARTGPSSGATFNQIGPALRDYPLTLLLYTAFVCATQTSNGDVLKRVLNIPLRQRAGDNRARILDVFFYVRRATQLFNTAFATRWCEPIATRIRQVLNDRIGELLPAIPESEYFFRGEFVLALTLVDRGISEKRPMEKIVPMPGLYLYADEANDAIREFVLERPDWLATLYRNPLPDILRLFDRNSNKAISFECFGTGLLGLNTSLLYESAVGSGSE